MEAGSLPKGRGKTKSLKDNLNTLFALAPSYSFPSPIPLTLMAAPIQLDFPLAKARYLFNHTTDRGVGDDKRKFWQQVMGFEAIRSAILKNTSSDRAYWFERFDD